MVPNYARPVGRPRLPVGHHLAKKYKMGDIVFHFRFGWGRVRAVLVRLGILQVHFRKAGKRFGRTICLRGETLTGRDVIRKKPGRKPASRMSIRQTIKRKLGRK